MSQISKSANQKSFASDLPVIISSGLYFSGLVSRSLITNQLKKASRKVTLSNVLSEIRTKAKKA